MKNGIGIFYDKFNRKQFEGEFVDDLQQGQGISYYNDNFDGTRVEYEGEWVNGEPDGKGIKYYQYGSTPKYDGTFKRGLYSGFGKLFEPNGCYYIGNFLYGVRDGIGARYLSNGTPLFEGTYKLGLKHGKCKEYYTDGSV